MVESYMAQQHAVSRKSTAGDAVAIAAATKPVESERVADVRDFRQQAFVAKGIANRIELFEFNPDSTGVQFGAGSAVIESVALLNEQNAVLPLTAGGEIVRLRITVKLLVDLQGLIVGFYVKDRLGQRLFGDNSHFATLDSPVCGMAGERIRADFVFRMPIMPAGSYMVDAAVASGSQDDHTQQHWIHDALEFKATDRTMRFGLIGIPMLAIEISQDQEI